MALINYLDIFFINVEKLKGGLTTSFYCGLIEKAETIPIKRGKVYDISSAAPIGIQGLPSRL